MFYKKLKANDLEELKKREELILGFRLAANALEMQKKIYLSGILPKYGCDLNKEYSIDFKTGKIQEQKNPQPPPPTAMRR